MKHGYIVFEALYSIKKVPNVLKNYIIFFSTTWLLQFDRDGIRNAYDDVRSDSSDTEW